MRKDKSKEYLIDPEPLLSAKIAFILLVSIFVVSTLLISLLYESLNVHYISIFVEAGLYCLPVILIMIAFGYLFRDMFRVHNFIRFDLILITLVSTIIVIILSIKIMEIVQSILPYSPDQVDWRQNLLTDKDGSPFWFIFLTVAVLPGFCEEILFRGTLQPAFMKKFGKPAGIIITSILFAAIHVSLQDFIPIFLLGIFLGVLAYRGGSFLYAALAHTLVNGMAVLGAVFANGGTTDQTDSGISMYLIVTISAMLVILIWLFFKLTPKRAIGKPDMYYI